MSDAPLVDARGMRCPWPVVRLARAIRDGAGPVRIWADDPIAAREIRALAEERGWALRPGSGEAPVDLIVLPSVNQKSAE